MLAALLTPIVDPNVTFRLLEQEPELVHGLAWTSTNRAQHAAEQAERTSELPGWPVGSGAPGLSSGLDGVVRRTEWRGVGEVEVRDGALVQVESQPRTFRSSVVRCASERQSGTSPETWYGMPQMEKLG